MSNVSGTNGKVAEKDPSMETARNSMRQLLAGIHISDLLAERSRVLVVDSELAVHNIFAIVLQEQHGRARGRANTTSSGLITPMAGGLSGFAAEGMSRDRDRGADGGMMQRGRMSREAFPGLDDPEPSESGPPVTMGVVAPSLPSDLLAEVFDFELSKKPAAETAGEDDAASFRRWTSSDDGWGVQAAASLQDLARMLPLGMPFCISEMAVFLSKAIDAAGKDGEECEMFNWSLSRWRSQMLQGQSASGSTSEARLILEERGRGGIPVVLHEVASAPPRPLLSIDDPEASLLRAVQLLLAYPEVSGIPIVSPLRCSVVAHLTLSACLMALVSRLRGGSLRSLLELPVHAKDDSGAAQETKRYGDGSAKDKSDSRWAEVAPPPGKFRPLQVLDESQPLSDLLTFFQKSPVSKAPIVNASGGVVGVMGRRDLLSYLDLAMQYAKADSDDAECFGSSRPSADPVVFQASTTLKEVCEALQRHPVESEEGAHDGEGPAVKSPKWLGACIIYEEQLPLKTALIRILAAENRTLLFAEKGDSCPKINRLLTVSDVWHIIMDALPKSDAKDVEVVDE
mmetsp:Transcript_18258/g.42722  ORF Transcript_18258/g.42722 Transcript_18258/m.42722 type:complete len:570 (-) Transcript_18258:118-1827(-)